MMEGVIEDDALPWFVLEHLLDQIEQVSMVFRIRHDVSLQTHPLHTVSCKPIIVNTPKSV